LERLLLWEARKEKTRRTTAAAGTRRRKRRARCVGKRVWGGYRDPQSCDRLRWPAEVEPSRWQPGRRGTKVSKEVEESGEERVGRVLCGWKGGDLGCHPKGAKGQGTEGVGERVNPKL